MTVSVSKTVLTVSMNTLFWDQSSEIAEEMVGFLFFCLCHFVFCVYLFVTDILITSSLQAEKLGGKCFMLGV